MGIEMCSSDRDAVRQMDLDAPGLGDSFVEQDDYDAPFWTIPPGEEGADFSHAGGEYEAFHSFAEDLAKLTGPLSYSNSSLHTSAPYQ